MAEPEKNFLQRAIDWFSGAIASVRDLAKRIGWVRTVLIVLAAAGGFIWWNWDDIAKRPGVERVLQLVEQRPLPKATAGRLTIAVKHLARDNKDEHEGILLDELGHFEVEGVEVLPVDRTVDPEEPAKKDAEDKARDLLEKTGADVLIWGSVISLGGKSAMRLNWTPARDTPGAKSTGKYQTETIALPPEFWSDLKQILGLLTQSRLAELTFDQPGQYVAAKLEPLIRQVRSLVEKKEGVWDAETLAGVRFGLATALAQDGEQTGNSEPLAESIGLYRQVLDEYTRARVPLEWALTQNNLGNALKVLGERESGTARLEEAVAAYREALQENTRARVPLQWAFTQMNLALVYRALFDKGHHPRHLDDALEAADGALEEFRKAKADFYIEKAERQRGQILAIKDNPKNGAAKK
jgi:tetratricopeptide (TPR) repeat protein